MIGRFGFLPALVGGLALAACATAPPGKDYTALNAASPRSILVVPVINNTTEVEAADLFLTTLPVPLAERGYYVMPVHTVRRMMEQSGLADPYLVHRSETPALAGLFGAQSVLYVEINEWKPQYAVTSSGIRVGFIYTLKSGTTGELLWQDQQSVMIANTSSSGNILADMLVAAVTAAMDNARSDYTPVAAIANQMAIASPGQGLPFGPYAPAATSNASLFPGTGTGMVSNATGRAVAWPDPGAGQAPAPKAAGAPAPKEAGAPADPASATPQP